MPHLLQKIRQVRVIGREINKVGLVGGTSLNQRRPAGSHGPNVKRGVGTKQERGVM